jgi:hypothetical protein
MQGVPISDVERALGLKFHAVREGVPTILVTRCKVCGHKANGKSTIMNRRVAIVDGVCSGCRRVRRILHGV